MPCSNGTFGCVAEQSLRFIELGKRDRQIFGTFRAAVDNRLLAERLFEQFDQSPHFHRLAVADVDALASDAVGGERGDEAGANVAHVREVATIEPSP